MLGKLMKYDIKANIRDYAILYILMAAVAIMARIMTYIPSGSHAGLNQILSLITTLMSGLVGGMAFAAVITWIIHIITRFRKNMFQEEGYLMHTLPVPARLLVFSKILTSLFFLFTTIIAIYLEYSILHGSITYIWDATVTSFQKEVSNSGGILIWLALIIVIQAVLMISAIYMSLSTGFRFKKDQDLWSAIVLIAAWAFYQAVTVLLLLCCFVFITNGLSMSEINMNRDMDLANLGSDALTYLLLFATICPTVGSIVCTSVTIFNLKKHLNLA